MLRRIHRLVESREMADTHDLLRRQRPQLQLDRGAVGKRAFRADKKMRQVDAVARRAARAKRHGIGDQRVDIIAADAAQHLWKPVENILPVRLAHRQQPRLQIGEKTGCAGAGDVTEAGRRPVMQDGVDGGDIVAHHAISD